MRARGALLIVACAHSDPQMLEQKAVVEQAALGLRVAERRAGDLRLSCDPPDSEVWLDGLPVGSCGEFSGRKGLSLGDRIRKVLVRKEGYKPFETWVEADGTQAALSVTLVPSNSGGEP